MTQIYHQKYKVLEEIGRGGMGTVYRVYDLHLGMEWAMKEIRLELGEKKEREQTNTEAEIRMLKKVNNVHFPRIVEVFIEEKALFLVMDLIHGKSLEQLICQEGTLSDAMLASVGIQIAEALVYLHTQQPQILYLDLKPSNIMLEENGTIKLIDFGSVLQLDKTDLSVCASHIEERNNHKTLSISGTYGFASPEQLLQSDKEVLLDTRSDIYSLGATLFYLAVRKKVGYGKDRVTSIRVWQPSKSEGIDKIIAKCLKERPQNRYQTMEELHHNLMHYKELEKRAIWIKRMEQAVLWIILIITALIWQQALAEIYRSGVLALKSASIKMLGTLLLCFLWKGKVVERRRLKPILYQQEKSVFLTACHTPERVSERTNAYRYLVLLFFLLFSLLLTKPVNANEKVELFPVTMRNEKLQKVLLKKEYTYHTNQTLFLELPPELFETDKEFLIRISSTNTENGAKKQYFFVYQHDNEKEAVK